MSLEEAQEKQLKYKYYEGAQFTHKESGYRYVVVSVMGAPSNASKLLEFNQKVSLYHIGGVNNITEIASILNSCNPDEFTVVLFARTVSEFPPLTLLIPLCQLVDKNGDVELGFDI